MFKTTSGEKLLELQAHDEDILCCAFSPDDRYIATCSSDRKVKVSVSVSVPILFIGQCLFVGQQFALEYDSFNIHPHVVPKPACCL